MVDNIDRGKIEVLPPQVTHQRLLEQLLLISTNIKKLQVISELSFAKGV